MASQTSTLDTSTDTASHNQSTEVDREHPASATRYTALGLRLIIGWVLFYSGLTKVLDPSWTASGYLTQAVPAANPLLGVWTFFAHFPLTDPLVQWGMMLTGFGLLIGALVPWNAVCASIILMLLWASSLPLEHAILVDEHIVYSAVLIGVITLRAGAVAGVDSYLNQMDFVRSSPILRRLIS